MNGRMKFTMQTHDSNIYRKNVRYRNAFEPKFKLKSKSHIEPRLKY